MWWHSYEFFSTVFVVWIVIYFLHSTSTYVSKTSSESHSVIHLSYTISHSWLKIYVITRVEILRLVSVSTVEIEANVWRRLRECEKRVYKCSAFIFNSLLVIQNCTYYRFPIFRGWGDGQLYRNTLSWFS